MSLGETVVTVIAGPGASLSASVIKNLSAALSVSRTDEIRAGQVVDLFCALSPVEVYKIAPTHIGDQPYDVIVQTAATRAKKVLVADMESTVIEQEMLDELAEMIGVGEKVALITRRAMNGEFDFVSALRERVALLKGKPQSLLDEAAKRITFMPGAAELVSTMKKQGALCWLVSGGFNCFVKPVAEKLGFDAFYANELIIKDGIITGEVAAP
ncbi:MAG TPA: phosphoserine phosphatase SerB, partial [Alphaproteobacteria bacterium]|nr:phosphoserine phosphatase SerB [Alphaproteobacteria bacterium]